MLPSRLHVYITSERHPKQLMMDRAEQPQPDAAMIPTLPAAKLPHRVVADEEAKSAAAAAAAAGALAVIAAAAAKEQHLEAQAEQQALQPPPGKRRKQVFSAQQPPAAAAAAYDPGPHVQLSVAASAAGAADGLELQELRALLADLAGMPEAQPELVAVESDSTQQQQQLEDAGMLQDLTVAMAAAASAADGAGDVDTPFLGLDMPGLHSSVAQHVQQDMALERQEDTLQQQRRKQPQQQQQQQQQPETADILPSLPVTVGVADAAGDAGEVQDAVEQVFGLDLLGLDSWPAAQWQEDMAAGQDQAMLDQEQQQPVAQLQQQQHVAGAANQGVLDPAHSVPNSSELREAARLTLWQQAPARQQATDAADLGVGLDKPPVLPDEPVVLLPANINGQMVDAAQFPL